MRIAARKFKENEFATSLEQAFRAFSNGNSNEITKIEIKNILTEYGPKLSEEQADRLVFDILGSEEKIDYISFIKQNLTIKKDYD